MVLLQRVGRNCSAFIVVPAPAGITIYYKSPGLRTKERAVKKRIMEGKEKIWIIGMKHTGVTRGKFIIKGRKRG